MGAERRDEVVDDELRAWGRGVERRGEIGSETIAMMTKELRDETRGRHSVAGTGLLAWSCGCGLADTECGGSRMAQSAVRAARHGTRRMMQDTECGESRKTRNAAEWRAG